MLRESTIEDAVEERKPKLLATVADYRVHVGVDSTGDAAVYITLVLDDTILDDIWAQRDDLRLQLEDLVHEVAGDDYVPYVFFQATSEQSAGAP